MLCPTLTLIQRFVELANNPRISDELDRERVMVKDLRDELSLLKLRSDDATNLSRQGIS